MSRNTAVAASSLLLVIGLGVAPVGAVAYPDQGDCSNINLSNPNPSSSRACPGISTSMLSIAFQSRSTECVYIDNVSTTSYFVPLGTPGEWDAFKAFRPSGTSIVYGCPQQSVTDVCGRSASLPEGRNGSTASSDGAVYSCVVLNSCGSWVAASIPPCSVPEPAPTTVAASEPVCTASEEICAAYARNTGRLPDQGGAAYWQDLWNRLAASGLSSAEINATLDREMGRSAEVVLHTTTGAVSIETGYMVTGTSAATSPVCYSGNNCGNAAYTPPVTAAQAQTRTEMNAIGAAYATALGRAPDQGGFDFWNAQVQSGAMTLDQAIHAITCSPEAVAKGTAPPGC